MTYTWRELREMRILQNDRISDLNKMLDAKKVGGYKNLDEVGQALKFEISELHKIEKEMQRQQTEGIN